MVSDTSNLDVIWRKSSFSANGNCVEVAVQDLVLIRDSKNPDGGIISVSSSAWQEFIQAIKRENAHCL